VNLDAVVQLAVAV